MSTGTELERRTQLYGREIFARLDRHGPAPFSLGWVDEKMMDLTMGDEALKVQMFRFIDALPLLKDPESISEHLREYLGARTLPRWVRWASRRLPRDGFGGQLLASAARTNATHLARRFISGSNVHEALETIRRLRERSFAFTLDLLGEATITEAEADAVQNEYIGLIRGLTAKVNHWDEVPLIDRDDRGPVPRVNVSIKLSALYSQFDPIDPVGTSNIVRRRLRPILREAMKHGAFVNFDMEQYSFKDATLQIFREILDEPEFRHWPDVGIAIQVYLKDTEEDLQQLLTWAQRRGTPVWIRLVKGAYWDFETILAAKEGWPVPVFTEKWQSDASFETCAKLLLENHDWLRPAFGSHNVRSISAALAMADTLAVPKGRYEFQMLYGMADEIKDVLVGMGHRVRVYTPFGQLLPGMAYLVRRLLENTSNESFLRASFKDNVSEDRLLMNPIDKGGRRTVDGGIEPSKNGQAIGGAQTAFRLPPSAFKNEPLTDFAKEANRRQMQRAIEEVRSQFVRNYPVVIDNRDVPCERWIDSINPSHTREIVGRCGQATPEQAKQAIGSCVRAFPAWRDTDVAERANYLRKVAAIFRRRRFELAAWMMHECGKPWREADGDVAEAIDFCEYYAAEMLKLAHPQHRDLAGEENEYFYEPRGVTIVIAPWNFPLAILCGMTTAALVAGNTVVMKPSEQSSVIAAKFMEVLREAEFPNGVVNYLPGVGEEIGPTLVEHPDVAVIAFTGSLQVGLHINREAANTPAGQLHVKRVIAEMGGKNAVIVDSDADLDEAVKGVVESAFNYQGQKCSAGSRAIVIEPLYDQFLHRLVEATKSIAVAPAESPACFVGPVIDAGSRDRILRMIEKGKGEAKLTYAADVGELRDEGYYIGPHIFADVPESASIAQEEIFGPVLSVMRAKDLDEALRIANGTRYALTGGFFSRSPKNIERVRREFRVGNLYINRKTTGALVDRQPFGGFKLSGIGSKAGGPDYLLQFLLPRTVTENTMRRGFAPVSNA